METNRPTDFISAIIYGATFSPRELLTMTDLPLKNSHEACDGWVRKTDSGTFKDGAASLVATMYPHSEGIQPFEDLLDTVVANYEAIKACGGTSITIWVALFNSVQGNWSMSEEHVQKLAAFNGSLAVSYYRDDDPVRPA